MRADRASVALSWYLLCRLFLALVVAPQSFHHELRGRAHGLHVAPNIGAHEMKPSVAYRDESVGRVLSLDLARKAAANVAVEQMDLAIVLAIDMADASRLIRFEELEDVGALETRKIPRQLAWLVASVVGDESLAAIYELPHTEGFEEVVVGTRRQRTLTGCMGNRCGKQ